MSNDFNLRIPTFKNALCAEVGFYDLFFPEGAADIRTLTPQAKKICGGCVHRVECLEWAINEGEQHGIWGGLTPRERNKLSPKRDRSQYHDQASRQVYLLKRDGLTWAEIAGHLQISVSTAQKRLERYLKKHNIKGD